MKLSRHAFRRFWGVHAWAGVLVSLVLYVMFFSGAFSVFREAIAAWQEVPHAAAPASSGLSLEAAIRRMVRDRGLAGHDIFLGVPTESHPVVEVYDRDPDGGQGQRSMLDARTGVATPERSIISTLLYHLHFLYHEDAAWGMYVAGVLGVALLLVLVTGVLIHLKDLARQLHQFRPYFRLRVLWSDLHKVLGVFGLPFQSAYALTGAFICLSGVLLGAFVGPVFGGDQAAAARALYGDAADPVQPPAEIRGEQLTADELVAASRVALPGFRPTLLIFQRYDRPDGLVEIWGEDVTAPMGIGQVVLTARGGAVLRVSSAASENTGATLNRYVRSFHYVRFGGTAMRALFALLALATCMTIVSGNALWLERRDPERRRRGNRVLERLTAGVAAGLCLATAAVFAVNRLAPAALESRIGWELGVFFGAWGLGLAVAAVVPARRAWSVLLGAAAVLLLAVPALSALTRSVSLVHVAGRWEVAGVDLGLALLGLALGGLAAAVRRGVTP